LILYSTHLIDLNVNLFCVGPERILDNTNASQFRLLNPHPVMSPCVVLPGLSVSVEIVNLSPDLRTVSGAVIGKIYREEDSMGRRLVGETPPNAQDGLESTLIDVNEPVQRAARLQRDRIQTRAPLDAQRRRISRLLGRTDGTHEREEEE
jgi:hypothetical protein